MRLVKRILDGDWDPQLARMESLWRNPATPTRAEEADANVKLTQGDRPVLPREAVWEDMGYSPERIVVLRRQFREQAADDLGLAGDGDSEGDDEAA